MPRKVLMSETQRPHRLELCPIITDRTNRYCQTKGKPTNFHMRLLSSTIIKDKNNVVSSIRYIPNQHTIQ